jgi:myo-inositol-1(or 4)-monophosphatase
MQKPLDNALELARKLKAVARENIGFFEDGVAHYAATGDATYEVDVPVEAAVKEYYSGLGVPSRVMTEDAGAVDYGENPQHIYLIDPLDGSRNARRNLPFHCCSIAVYDVNATELSHVLCGVVERFDADEEFVAVKGGGATLNGEPIKPSSKSTLDDAVLSLGAHFAGAVPLFAESMGRLNELVERDERSVWIKCYGATALELAYLACGRIDLIYDIRASTSFKATPKTYDIAAGILLAREADAVVEYGGDMLPQELPVDPNVSVQVVGAGNPQLFKELGNTLR